MKSAASSPTSTQPSSLSALPPDAGGCDTLGGGGSMLMAPELVQRLIPRGVMAGHTKGWDPWQGKY